MVKTSKLEKLFVTCSNLGIRMYTGFSIRLDQAGCLTYSLADVSRLYLLGFTNSLGFTKSFKRQSLLDAFDATDWI